MKKRKKNQFRVFQLSVFCHFDNSKSTFIDKFELSLVLLCGIPFALVNMMVTVRWYNVHYSYVVTYLCFILHMDFFLFFSFFFFVQILYHSSFAVSTFLTWLLFDIQWWRSRADIRHFCKFSKNSQLFRNFVSNPEQRN